MSNVIDDVSRDPRRLSSRKYDDAGFGADICRTGTGRNGSRARNEAFEVVGYRRELACTSMGRVLLALSCDEQTTQTSGRRLKVRSVRISRIELISQLGLS